jgi:hypothetical protein
MLLDLFVTLLCVTSIPGVFLAMAWYLATKKGWNTVRLLALGITILLIGISFIFWILTKDNVILIGGILLSIAQGVIVLNWPTLSPEIMNRLRLRK